ncbi:MAG TPA: aquaporin [Ignavibacteria bacterium]|nr:aquaporin [Ignavibacteria bacterium]
MNKYLVEFIGTFFLVLTIGMVVIDAPNSPAAPAGTAPIAIGSILMVMIYAGGHISGAHYNPAVTLGVCMRGKCEYKDMIPYMASQILGAVLAGVVIKYFKAGATITAISHNAPASLLVEVLFTFALVFVVLNVATLDSKSGNSFYGLAIGFTVTAGAYAVGSISGGAFNPAVAIGISFLGLSSWGDIWIYLVGNFAGAILAALTFKMINKNEA